MPSLPFRKSVIFGAFFVAACGGSSTSTSANCSQSSKCPNDPAPTADNTASCNAALHDPTCGAKYQTFLDCQAKNQQCNGMGQTDEGALITACGAEMAAAFGCDAPDGGAGD